MSFDIYSFVFPSDREPMRSNPELLKAAKEGGFDSDSHPYNKKFSELFFKGGEITFKKDLNPEFKQKAFSYCRAFMQSWTPSHEQKSAICAFLLSFLIEL